MYRALVISTIDAEYWIDDEFDEIFRTFKLPIPDMHTLTMSTELRGAINALGISVVIFDGNDDAMIRHIPPYQIVHADYYVAKVEPKTKTLAYITGREDSTPEFRLKKIQQMMRKK